MLCIYTGPLYLQIIPSQVQNSKIEVQNKTRLKILLTRHSNVRIDIPCQVYTIRAKQDVSP